jgi:mRNA-degrading endonuclease YafQ of YafQ-DinJ toxin-antitoxin module
MPQYRIQFKSRAVEKAWQQYEQDFPDAMAACTEFLETSPLDRLQSRNKLKKLKGKLSGILQYDLTFSERIWYKVDASDNTVNIEYIGSHP